MNAELRGLIEKAKKKGLILEAPRPKPTPKAKVKSGNQEVFLALCEKHGLPKPEPEYQFHPTRKWRADWAFGSGGKPWLLVEIEGAFHGMGKECELCGQRKQGGHNSHKGRMRDLEKYREAAILGYTVLRVLPEEIETGVAFQLIKRALRAFENLGEKDVV